MTKTSNVRISINGHNEAFTNAGYSDLQWNIVNAIIDTPAFDFSCVSLDRSNLIKPSTFTFTYFLKDGTKCHVKIGVNRILGQI